MFVENQIIELFKAHLRINSITNIRALGGGFQNASFKVATTKGDFFLKINGKDNTVAEVKGLELLRSTQTIDIPVIVGHGESEEKGFLILDFISGSRKTSYCKQLGEQLALLHCVTQSQFGLNHDNFIGALPQINLPHDSWVEFFTHCRLLPQIEMAKGKLSQKAIISFEKLIPRLGSLLPDELPSLLHGDLWSGNIMTNNNGNPILIDPAVYFGHRETEIAFTHLFGGFDDEFYEAYRSTFPLLRDFEERIDLYNLYPLLVHVNMFGGGYTMQVESILKSYV